MIAVISAFCRPLLPAHFRQEPSHPCVDHPVDSFIPLIKAVKRLRNIGNRHPTHFHDLRQQLDALAGKLDRVARRPPGRQVKASTIARLGQRLALLSHRYEQRRRLVEGWACTAKAFRSTGAPSFSPARPPGAPSRRPD